jgi:glycerol-3-phosphate dehydrogenase
VTRQSDHTIPIRSEVEAITARPRAQVLIIGGGINGLGTFRDLALQGVDVILVERNDFASGASSASSHMIHGGIRYLENGEFRLVRESVRERNGLLRIAPHYVKPLPTTIPIFSTFSGVLAAPLRFLTHKQGKPKERGAFLIKIGLTIYDSFSRDGGSVPRHKFIGHSASLKALPALNVKTRYTATYYDGSLVNPERLALDVMTDGLNTGPHARAANYVEAIGAADDQVRLRDRVSGREFTVKADVVVNTSGPWTDLTNAALGVETAFMGGTKGSHIVLDNEELLEACAGRELFFENDDGRIVLIYPLMGRVLVGTTDLEADMGVPAVCTEEEIDYFFELVSHVFPGIRVDRDQIVFRFAGVRPLPHHEDTQPGFVSRDYRIAEDQVPGLPGTKNLSLVGGKWTTFRALGEHLANDVLALLGRERSVSTAGLAIGGGVDFPATEGARRDWGARYGADIGEERALVLLERYGTKARDIIAYLTENGDTPLRATSEYSVAEIQFLAEREHVVHLNDMLLRRTSVAFRGLLTNELVSEIAEILAHALGWNPAQQAEEVAEAARELGSLHGLLLDSGSVTRSA